MGLSFLLTPGPAAHWSAGTSTVIILVYIVLMFPSRPASQMTAMLSLGNTYNEA